MLFFFLGWGLLSVEPGLAQTAPPGAGDTLTVTVLHSNDLYGQLTRRPLDGGLAGGMAPRVHLIRRVKAGGRVLLLDAGNTLGPAPLSASDRGESMIELMRMAGYDAMLPANHEFNYGLDTLRRLREVGGFPFLGANIAGADTLIQPALVVEAGGPRIGVIGLISPEVATLTNPRRVSDLTFKDPVAAAKEALKTLSDRRVDCVILLAHMREEEAMKLAHRVEGVDLVVAGGYYSVGLTDQMPTSIRLGNGVRIVAAPGYGDGLGRVDIRFAPRPDGGYRAISTLESQLAVDASVPDDPEAALLIARLEQSYAAAFNDTLGYLRVDTPDGQAALIAQLIQAHTGTEIGLINRGAVEPVDTGRPLLRGDVDRLIRFPDRLVTMTLTGAQLRALATQSRQAVRPSARLVFAGMDEQALTVLRRLLRDEESYRIATTEFLANGGDGYRIFLQGRAAVSTGVDLRALVDAALQEHGVLSLATFRDVNRAGSWYAGWDVEGAFERNFVDGTTEEYRQQNENVSFLSGATTFAWNSAVRLYAAYQQGVHETRLDHGMDFGQIGRNLDNLTKTSDQIATEVRYRYLTPRSPLNPFISVGANTAFTRSNGQRPLLVRSSLGFQRQVSPRVLVGFAGRSQRDFVVDTNDFGTEITVEVNQTFKTGSRLKIQARSFVGLTDRRVLSVENYNTLNVPLIGALRLNIRQSNFVYRVNRIRDTPVSGVAFRTNLTVGFGYGLDWKWR
jgi:2',3'-cyclic-nucleotide 2'-phosphodiesterase (5'-nucleotidase family)